MRGGMISVAVLLALTLTGCATVDVTKTAKGFFEPTRPDDSRDSDEQTFSQLR